MDQDNIPLAVAYRLNAVNFRLSAEKLAKDIELNNSGCPKQITAIPLYFLANHAAELFLKAALLKRGFHEKELKKQKYRHNLAALIQELELKNVPITENTKKVLEGLSEQHMTHQLRYTILLDDGKKHIVPPYL